MTLFVALLLEYFKGDPSNAWHPVAWLGHFASRVAQRTYQPTRLAGIVTWLLVVGLSWFSVWLLHNIFGWIADILIVWLCLGWKSLFVHVQAVLDAKTIKEAKAALAMIVSRDTKGMKREDTRRAALESLAENASDAVIAPLFWFLLFGPLGAAFYRMVNTLDAMWGYRNERYQSFGWCAAKVDDVMNYIPARITAWLMLRVGQSVPWSVLKAQSSTHASPNAGYPEVALAYAANIKLGGDVKRDGKVDTRPFYGQKNAREIDAIAAFEAQQIVRNTLLWAATFTGVITIVF